MFCYVDTPEMINTRLVMYDLRYREHKTLYDVIVSAAAHLT